MLHTKFRGNRPAGSGKEEFKGILPYVGMAVVLVMRPASCHQIFISLYLKAFIKKLVQIGKVVSENFYLNIMYTTLGQGQEMTLTFNTHIPSYIQLDDPPANFQVTGCNSF